MPTIVQLPAATQTAPADEIPISQSGVTRAVTVGTLLEGTQPAILSDTGSLLGRTSLGTGGPESVAVGVGLAINAGTLAASGTDHATFPQQTSLVATDQAVLNSGGQPMLLALSLLRNLFSAGTNITIDSSGTISAAVTGNGGTGTGASYSITALTTVASIAANDLVAISQAGADHTITYGNFLDGLTIDLAQPAVPAADTDTFWVAQGSSTMLRQTFAAIWSWLTPKLPSYKLPVVELTTTTTLDGTVHNGRILVCSQPITLNPAALNMGSGFYCDVLNLSSGTVTFGTGIVTSSGTSTLPSGQTAALRTVSYSGGTVVFATISGAAGTGTTIAMPGQVISLSTASPTTSSIALNWSAPASGGSVTGYTVQFRVTGTTNWSTFVTGLVTTSASVTGLAAATSYDFQVFGTNASGAGPASAAVTGTTAAAGAGSVTGVTWNMVPSGSYVHGGGSIGVNAHITPSTAAVQFGFSTSATVPPTNWVVANYVNTDLWGSYVSIPSSPGTWYVWVEGVDGSYPNAYPTPFTVT